MERNYFKEYFELERSHWWFLVRRDIIVGHLKTITKGKSNLKILNVGAATGYSSEFLQKFGEVVSVEYDKDCCEFVSKQLGKNFINASITALPFDNASFDLVCAFDVIEHVEEDQLAVQELKRVTLEGGLICTTVPAYGFLWSQHDDINHHVRRYTRPGFRKLFISDGAIMKASYFNTLLFLPIAIFRILSQGQKRKASPSSDFGVGTNSLASSIARFFFSLEVPILATGISFPFGVSILLSWRKTVKK